MSGTIAARRTWLRGERGHGLEHLTCVLQSDVRREVAARRLIEATMTPYNRAPKVPVGDTG